MLPDNDPGAARMSNMSTIKHLKLLRRKIELRTRKKVKNVEKKQQAAVNVGEVAWD